MGWSSLPSAESTVKPWCCLGGRIQFSCKISLVHALLHLCFPLPAGRQVRQWVPLGMGQPGALMVPTLTDPAWCGSSSGCYMAGEGALDRVSVRHLAVFVCIAFFQSLSKNVSLATGCSSGIPRL